MSRLAPRCCRTPDLAASRGSPRPDRYGDDPQLGHSCWTSRGDAPNCGRARRNTYPLHVPDSKLQAQMLHDRVLFSAEDQFEVEVRGQAYLVMRERDLHAVANERVEHGTGLYL